MRWGFAWNFCIHQQVASEYISRWFDCMSFQTKFFDMCNWIRKSPQQWRWITFYRLFIMPCNVTHNTLYLSKTGNVGAWLDRRIPLSFLFAHASLRKKQKGAPAPARISMPRLTDDWCKDQNPGQTINHNYTSSLDAHPSSHLLVTQLAYPLHV